MTIKAIETEYKGYLFRSRLEARWGVFFDSLGIKWQYETEGYEIDTYRYLPDFFLPDLGAFVEVKGDPQGLRQEFDRLRVVLGPASPLPGFADGIMERSSCPTLTKACCTCSTASTHGQIPATPWKAKHGM
jgi:hypothetical protein